MAGRMQERKNQRYMAGGENEVKGRGMQGAFLAEQSRGTGAPVPRPGTGRPPEKNAEERVDGEGAGWV